MGLGHQKGHVHGDRVSGGHTTLIDGADDVVRGLGRLSWFDTVRPSVIKHARGGSPSVTIRLHNDPNHRDALKLIFRKSGSAQDVYLHVPDLNGNLRNVIADITRVVGERLHGIDVHDRTAERIAEDVRGQVKGVIDGRGRRAK